MGGNAGPCVLLSGIPPLPFSERFGDICSQNHDRYVWEVFFMAEPGIQLEVEGKKEEVGHWKLEAGPAYHTLWPSVKAPCFTPASLCIFLGTLIYTALF